MLESLEAGIHLFTMRVRTPRTPKRGAVVLTHGAGSGSSAIWDLRYADYSMMRYLACLGFDAYALDVRGFGGSTMPRALSLPAEAGPPTVRAFEVMKDLHALVLHATRSSSVAAVDVVGWSWGSEVAGMYSGLHPTHVRRLALLAPLYDRRWPSRHQNAVAWYSLDRKTLEGFYRAALEERPVWDEFVAALFRFDDDDRLRLPSGPYRDVYGDDAPVWDAARVRAPCLILRGDQDPASLDAHAKHLYDALKSAASRRYLVIEGTGHFLFRERRHKEVQRVLGDFLTDSP